jgi:LysM repeat protein
MQNARTTFLAFTFVCAAIASRGQNQATIINYINQYSDVAIAEMERSGVPASITIAQGIHETMAGTSDLVVKSNNHFGIKCKSGWTGESVSHDDDARGECFRKYTSPEDSYRDHSDFLKGSPRYASLFQLDPLNYTGWAYGLKKAGYATNPRYPQIIVKLIEDYNLQEYTLIALGKAQRKTEEFAKADIKKSNDVISAVLVTTEKPAKPARIVVAEKAYPQGEFRINDTRVVYAKEGTSLLSIAQQYDVLLARLYDFNDMNRSEVLANDQLIFLQRKRKVGGNEFHVVRESETVYDIAQEEGIRLEALLEYNQLQPNMQPAVGERLNLKARTSVRPMLAKVELIKNEPIIAKNERNNISVNSQPRIGEFVMHTVQSKETIYSISRKYSVKADDLAEWNQLENYELKTGQQLKIYK